MWKYFSTQNETQVLQVISYTDRQVPLRSDLLDREALVSDRVSLSILENPRNFKLDIYMLRIKLLFC